MEAVHAHVMPVINLIFSPSIVVRFTIGTNITNWSHIRQNTKVCTNKEYGVSIFLIKTWKGPFLGGRFTRRLTCPAFREIWAGNNRTQFAGTTYYRGVVMLFFYAANVKQIERENNRMKGSWNRTSKSMVKQNTADCLCVVTAGNVVVVGCCHRCCCC